MTPKDILNAINKAPGVFHPVTITLNPINWFEINKLYYHASKTPKTLYGLKLIIDERIEKGKFIIQ